MRQRWTKSKMTEHHRTRIEGGETQERERRRERSTEVTKSRRLTSNYQGGGPVSNIGFTDSTLHPLKHFPLHAPSRTVDERERNGGRQGRVSERVWSWLDPLVSHSTPTLPSHTISSISVGNEAKAGHTHSHSLTHTLTNPLTHNAYINTLTDTQTHNERHIIILTCAHTYTNRYTLTDTYTDTFTQIHKRTHTHNPMNLHTYLSNVDNQDENPQVRTLRSHPHKKVTVLPHYLFFSFFLSLSRTSQIWQLVTSVFHICAQHLSLPRRLSAVII